VTGPGAGLADSDLGPEWMAMAVSGCPSIGLAICQYTSFGQQPGFIINGRLRFGHVR